MTKTIEQNACCPPRGFMEWLGSLYVSHSCARDRYDLVIPTEAEVKADPSRYEAFECKVVGGLLAAGIAFRFGHPDMTEHDQGFELYQRLNAVIDRFLNRELPFPSGPIGERRTMYFGKARERWLRALDVDEL